MIQKFKNIMDEEYRRNLYNQALKVAGYSGFHNTLSSTEILNSNQSNLNIHNTKLFILPTARKSNTCCPHTRKILFRA
jgi:hypothetical protein